MHDCLIIGGGVIGLSLAYELSRRGLSVHVIDRAAVGKEASWAGAGILPPANAKTAVHPLDKLRALSHQLHSAWAATLREETGIDTGYRRCGGIYVARSAGEAAALHGMKRLLDEEQVAVERLSSEDLARHEPALAHLSESRVLKAAYRLPDEAQLRNPDHLRALAAACRKQNVLIDENAEVVAFEIIGEHMRGVRTQAGSFVAGSYCITAGAWTQVLLKRLEIPSDILPVRGQMVMFRCVEPPFSHVINEGPRYLVPRDDGRVLAGSTEEEVGFDKRTTAEAIDELTRFARELVPQLHHAAVERTWAGLRPGSFDGFPYLGLVPGLANVFVAAGHFRSGLFLSPATAVVMSELIRGEQPQIDLTPFRVGRG